MADRRARTLPLRGDPRAEQRRLLRPYYLYQAAVGGSFHSPIFFVFYAQQVGLQTPAVLWLQSGNLVLRALLEVPAGALADRWSRRACLALSAACFAVGLAALLLAPSLQTAILAETLFATGTALRAGVDSALLFDGMRSLGREAEYPAAESRAQAISALGAGAGAVIGAGLASFDVRWPYLATLLAMLVALAATLRMGAAEQRPHAERVLGVMADALSIVVRTAPVRWVFALSVVAVVASHVYYYVQQPYMQLAGVPIFMFGVVFAATKLVTAAVASQAWRVDATLGARRSAALMCVVPTLGMLAMSAVLSPVGAALLLSRGVLDGLWQPLTLVYLNRYGESRLRATLLSLQNLTARLALAATVALIGLSTQGLGLATTLALAAAATAVVGTLLIALTPRELRA